MSKRRRSSGGRRVAEAKFWGSPSDLAPFSSSSSSSDRPAIDGTATDGPSTDGSAAGGGRSGGAAPERGPVGGDQAPRPTIRPTPDPSVLVRSLGAPPLSVDHAVAERHLAAVYEEAVRAATALAAAGGLLDLGDGEP